MSSSISARRRRYAFLARVSSISPASPNAGSRQAGGLAAVDVCDAAGLGGDEIQHVEFPARVGEEPGEVMHALEVAHADGVPVEDHRPVITLATKDVDAPRLVVERVAVRDVRCRGNRRRGFDPVEDRAGRLALQVGALVAAAGVVGVGEAKAGERRFVGGADFVPQPHRFGQGLFCARRIAVGEPHASSGVGGAGDQRFALESGGDEIELVCGRSRPVDVAGRDLDLDLRFEQRGASAGRCSVVAPWTAPARGARGRLGSRPPQPPRRLGPDAPGRDPVGDPTRRDERPAGLALRRRCLAGAVGSVPARSAATPARAAGRGAVPRTPSAPDSAPRGTTRAA